MDIFEKQKFYNELSFFTLCNAAPTLGKFFNETVHISSPRTEIITMNELEKRSKNWVYATVSFNKGEIGNTHMFLSETDALTLAEYAIAKRFHNKQELNVWNEMKINAVEEIMNILGGNMTEILTVIYGIDVELEVPELKLKDDALQKGMLEEGELVLNSFVITLGEEKKIKMKEVASYKYYEDLVAQLKKRV